MMHMESLKMIESMSYKQIVAQWTSTPNETALNGWSISGCGTYTDRHLVVSLAGSNSLIFHALTKSLEISPIRLELFCENVSRLANEKVRDSLNN